MKPRFGSQPTLHRIRWNANHDHALINQLIEAFKSQFVGWKPKHLRVRSNHHTLKRQWRFVVDEALSVTSCSRILVIEGGSHEGWPDLPITTRNFRQSWLLDWSSFDVIRTAYDCPGDWWHSRAVAPRSRAVSTAEPQKIRPEPRSISLYEYFSWLSCRIKVLSSCRS